jgi:hypothetical protein
VSLLSLSRSTKPIGLSFGSFSHWFVAAIIAGIAFVAVQAGQRTKGPTRATLTGLAAGLVFGIQDALTRQTLEVHQGQPVTALFTAWPLYALVGTGIVGLWLMQNAFSAGPLHDSLPAIAAGEPVAGIVLGIVVFGDRIQISPGPLAIEAGGIATLIVGVVAVARSSAFGGLRKITDVITPHGSSEGSAGRHDGPAPRHDGPAPRHDGPAPRHDGPPSRRQARAHRREDLAGLRDDPPARPDLADGQVSPPGARRDRRGGRPRRRQFHGPASGEEGG